MVDRRWPSMDSEEGFSEGERAAYEAELDREQREAEADDNNDLILMNKLELMELIHNAWHDAVEHDLENGVAWMNDEAAKKFAETYPRISSFGETLSKLSDKISEEVI